MIMPKTERAAFCFWRVFWRFLAYAGHSPANSAGTQKIIVSNEKSNTLSILDANAVLTQTIETCARPRGMKFSADRTQFYVGCADDSEIAIYDVASMELVRRIRGVEEPETFDLHPDGRRLIISNEEDAEASVVDVETGEYITGFETGEEPEGVQITPDGKYAFVASEAANMVHVIDIEAETVVKDILVDTRPRRFALSPDGKELWVSAELAGMVDIIDVASLTVTGDIQFLPTGFRKEEVTPVDVLITRDGDARLCRARPRQPCRRRRRQDPQDPCLYPGGQAPLGAGALA